jgi:hypothetical protein
MYFKKFPNLIYDFNINGKTEYRRVKDITRNIRFRQEVLENITLYDEYDIIDGETPEIIAEKVYGNPNYHWIVMLANQRYDYRKDFPLTQISLDKYIEEKYGAESDAIHHWEDADGIIQASTVSGVVSVSNRQYEERVNEEKRRIKRPSKNVIAKILKEYKELI